MKKQLLTFAMAAALSPAAWAANTVEKVAQVTNAVTLTEDVDYTITGETPFTTTGSINLTNTEHAVIIFENIRPSDAFSYLGFIQINGEDAVDGENCQVKMYASGTIIMPYGKDFKPLTVYSEPDFGGESVNDFGTEHSGGYMNTLTAAKLNNRIRSFKLKRGYMVTFSNSPRGRGYSRCFIADKEDLEFAELPKEMDGKISSYRVFQWYNYEKKGIASDGGALIVDTLNVTWCYDWGQGNGSNLPDAEWVPHHIYEDWPSVATCGSVTQSCHMQTNNEPGNSADDHPQDVETVLNNWENLMATGMRLCSPSSHDGSLGWLREFMDAIDARGWRCDILDMHCYWNQWNLNNALKGYYDIYKRPIWVSEFVWGASWGGDANNKGIFATDGSFSIENQQKNYDVMTEVLTNWNNFPYVERYAYWNSEADCSKLFKYNDQGGELSLLGKWYADMKSGMGYNKAYEYVPTVVIKKPGGLALDYTERTRELVLTWNHPNLEFTDSAFLEVRFNEGEWQTVKKYTGSELENSSMRYTETFPEDFQRGIYTYRVHNYDIDGEERMTDEVQLSVVGAEGEAGFQYGTLKIADTNDFYTSFTSLGEEETPAVFTGLISYKNSGTVPVNTVMTVLDDRFSFHVIPWSEGDYEQTISNPETTDFMVLKKGAHKIGDLTLEVGESGERIKNESTWISFATPFPEGVTPVVIVNVLSRHANPYVAKVWGITNEGFTVKLRRQAALDDASSSFVGQEIFYVAATPGTAKMDNGKILTVGRNTEDLVDGRRYRPIDFVDEAGETVNLFNPVMLMGPQTDNYSPASVYRMHSYSTDNKVVDHAGTPATTGARIIRQKDNTDTTTESDFVNDNGDVIGWIAVSDDPEGGSGIEAVKQQSPLKVTARDGQIVVEGTDDYSIYAIGGQQVSRHSRLGKGLYVVKAGDRSAKVLVP